MNPKVMLKSQGGMVLVFPLGFLGERFSAYRSTVDEVRARYVSEPRKGNLMDEDNALLLVPKLKAAGFEPVLDTTLAQHYAERASHGCVASQMAATQASAPAARRGESNALEAWAIYGLAAVAALDGDRARELNHVGFSRNDGDLGHSLLKQYRERAGLTERQWAAVVKLARRYRRQLDTAEPEVA